MSEGPDPAGEVLPFRLDPGAVLGEAMALHERGERDEARNRLSAALQEAARDSRERSAALLDSSRTGPGDVAAARAASERSAVLSMALAISCLSVHAEMVGELLLATGAILPEQAAEALRKEAEAPAHFIGALAQALETLTGETRVIRPKIPPPTPAVPYADPILAALATVSVQIGLGREGEDQPSAPDD
jgi:hypothetical protein